MIEVPSGVYLFNSSSEVCHILLKDRSIVSTDRVMVRNNPQQKSDEALGNNHMLSIQRPFRFIQLCR